jgi:Molydopterin dinucleotide binding domain
VVRRRSANGELTGIAKIDDSVRRGAVSIPHGHHAANVNHLTNEHNIEVVTGMVRYSGIPVSLPGVTQSLNRLGDSGRQPIAVPDRHGDTRMPD